MIIWRGKTQNPNATGTIQAVLTGYVDQDGRGQLSRNAKTGMMLQLRIQPSGTPPNTAIRTGRDCLVCGGTRTGGGCEHRPINQAAIEASGRVFLRCYVRTEQGELSTWKAHKGRQVDDPADLSLLRRLGVRIGAWGDPAFIPVAVIRNLCQVAGMWTGYTHFWRSAPYLRSYCMASVRTKDEASEARAAGWRTYRTREPDEPLDPRLEIQCPASAETGHQFPNGRPATCQSCGLCNGAGHGVTKSVSIAPHGFGCNTRAGR